MIRENLANLQRIAKSQGYKLDKEFTESSLIGDECVETTQIWVNGKAVKQLRIVDCPVRGRLCALAA